MRILSYIFLLLALLLLVPFVSAQDSNAEEETYQELFIEEDSYLTLDDVIGEHGCPVGIRELNRELEINSDSTIVEGQTLLIPLDSPLCDIDYTGEIEYFDLKAYDELRQANTSYYPAYIPANEFSAEHNVCEEALWELNPEWVELWESWAWPSFTYVYTGMYPFFVRIPVDSPDCFETVELAPNQHPRDLAEELNICEHIVWYYNPETIYYASTEARPIYIPIERQPCILDGEILRHEGGIDYGDYVPVEIVRLETAMRLYDFARQQGYCYSDLFAYNRHEYIAPLRQGDAVYVPENIQECGYVGEAGQTLVSISYDYNVCLEALTAINQLSTWAVLDEDSYWAVQVPLDSPDCYDDEGKRLNFNDRLVHQTSEEDWLYGIAQQYNLCMNDLFASNPLLADYPRADLPSIIFIPDVPACSDDEDDGFIHHIVRPAELTNFNSIQRNYRDISYIYNVCLHDLVMANPDFILEESSQYFQGWYWAQAEDGEYRAWLLKTLEAGDELLIPANQRPCYDFYMPMAGIGLYRGIGSTNPMPIDYLCYEQEIDLSRDYTDHEPVISPVAESDNAWCYDSMANPYIVLENETYTLYPAYGDSFLFEIAECFGVDAYSIIQVSYSDLGLVTDYPDAWRYWGIPNPTQDCPLIGDDRDAAKEWKRNFYQNAAFGQLNEDGEYAVTYGDTLSSIGRRYGYLPEWIMAENNLPDETVYIYQTLRLPAYPNIYTLSTYGSIIAGGLLLMLGGSFALKLRAKGRKGKRKNDE